MSRRRKARALHHKALARDKRDSIGVLTAPVAPASHVALTATSEREGLAAPESATQAVTLASAATEPVEAVEPGEPTRTPPPVSTTTIETAPSSVSAQTMAASFEEEDPMPSVPAGRLDEGSLPPLTSTLLEDEDEDALFFAKKVTHEADTDDDGEVEDPAVRLAREATELRAAARRSNSRKYVAAVVGFCALVGGLGFSTRLIGTKNASSTGVSAAAQVEQTQALAPLPAIELKAAPVAQAPAAPVAPVAAVAPKADDIAHPDDVVVPVKEEPKVDAKAEKKAAQRALEGGKVASAIEHATASVTADETDAEAWLLLGASYQEKGQIAKARESFQSCMKLAKRGPKGECAAMLR